MSRWWIGAIITRFNRCFIRWRWRCCRRLTLPSRFGRFCDSQSNTEVLMDEVVAIDSTAREVSLGSGARLHTTTWCSPRAQRTLILAMRLGAAGSRASRSIEDATEIRRRVLLAFELAERQMQERGWHPPLNFVVIGGGPTGVELAGAISDIAKLYMRHDFRHIDPTTAAGVCCSTLVRAFWPLIRPIFLQRRRQS